MFKEIENELLSIINDDPIEKIAHMPTKDIAKTMDLIYKIKFEDIRRVYTSNIADINTITVIYHNDDKLEVDHDICMINGKVHYILFFPEVILNKNENNAIIFTKAIIAYISCKTSIIFDIYDCMIRSIKENTLRLTIIQSIPVITCAIMRKIYSGPTLSKLIYMSLCDSINTYKSLYTEEGIDTILNLFDEGLGVDELLDNSFICSIRPDDKNYPGIWCNVSFKDNEDKS